MTEQKKVKQSCDDINLLMSRNLDGDLDRSETLRLYEHLGSCAECRDQMRQISTLGDSMDDLKILYQGHVPSPQLKRSIHDAISERKIYRNVDDETISLFSKLRNWLFLPIVLKPSSKIVGMAFAVCFCVLLWQQVSKLNPDRLIVHKIPLRSAEDLVVWNRQHAILPSQVIRLDIHEFHPDPYYFQLSSSKPVDFSITHNQEIYDLESLQKYRLHGVQYIILNNPHSQDFVNIYNHGIQPISLKTFSFRPQAIQANFK